MRLLAIVFTTLLLTAACATRSITPDLVKPPETWGQAENVTQLKHLYFSDQPDAEALRIAASRGVTTVINLRDPEEMDWNEQQVAEQLGLRYVNIPVSKESDTLDREAMSAIEEVVNRQDGQPVLLHCSSGNRAAGWLATHLVDTHGMGVEEAVEVARKAGITSDALEKRVRTYLNETR